MRILTIVLCFVAFTVHAVEPNEILSDPALEARARAISKDLRCTVCRNENIDSSNAGIARDLRILVRERLMAGDTDEQVIEQVVGRYGEFVLLNPTKTGANLILWIFGPLALLIGFGLSVLYVRRSGAKPQKTLSNEEEARLNELLKSE